MAKKTSLSVVDRTTVYYLMLVGDVAVGHKKLVSAEKGKVVFIGNGAHGDRDWMKQPHT